MHHTYKSTNELWNRRNDHCCRLIEYSRISTSWYFSWYQQLWILRDINLCGCFRRKSAIIVGCQHALIRRIPAFIDLTWYQIINSSERYILVLNSFNQQTLWNRSICRFSCFLLSFNEIFSLPIFKQSSFFHKKKQNILSQIYKLVDAV